MEALVISPNFTIEDIHKLREYNYYQTKDMAPQERRNYYNERGRAFQKEIEAGRLQKKEEILHLIESDAFVVSSRRTLEEIDEYIRELRDNDRV